MTHREITIAKTSELKDGEMRQVSADGTDILLARVGGKYHAVGAHCTHYGVPLVEGALCGERVVCPWHHACFNVATGDLEEPPALDALPRYGVRVEGESVIVSLPDEISDRRTPAMTKMDSSSDARLFVILGGGAAGYAAAQTLREDGFKGRVLMITREDRPRKRSARRSAGCFGECTRPAACGSNSARARPASRATARSRPPCSIRANASRRIW